MRKALFVLAAVAVGGIAVAVLGRDRRARHYVPDHRSFGSPSGPAPVEEREPAKETPVVEVAEGAVEVPVVEPTPVAHAPVSIEPFVPAFTDAVAPEAVPAEIEAEVVDSEWNELEPDPDEAASFSED